MDAKVLFAVLNWGLGHATRSVPVIKSILNYGAELELATTGIAAAFLKNEFPNLIVHHLEDKEVIYSSKGAKTALFKRAFQQEAINISQQREIRRLCAENDITHIVSDNVYGAYDPNLKNALITHQLSLKTPFGSGMVNRRLANWINKFSEVWIPDDPEFKLAGRLAQNPRVNVPRHHLGILSRIPEPKSASVSKYKIGVLLGGPEPQRSILEERVLDALNDVEGKKVIFRGSKDSQLERTDWKIYNFGTAEEMGEIIQACELVISRSGYSSVMDLMGRAKSILLVPTPGQTEQEYLAEHLTRFPNVLRCNQENLDSSIIEKALQSKEDSLEKPTRFDDDGEIVRRFLRA
ncbi:MAG: glycosyltransferase [Bacteroidota bacterium]